MGGTGQACKNTTAVKRDLSRGGKDFEAPEKVVADAVAIEPVSASQFPANREKNREFSEFKAIARISVATKPMISGLLGQTPVAANREIFRPNRVFLTQEQGISLRYSAINRAKIKPD